MTNWCTIFLSIHAPTRGATIYVGAESANCSSFNPRSYKRSDMQGTKWHNVVYLSIHAPTRGATINFYVTLQKIDTFNPRSYKRSDGLQMTFHTQIFIFQSTLLQEERLTEVIQLHLKHVFQSTLLQEERQLIFPPY